MVSLSHETSRNLVPKKKDHLERAKLKRNIKSHPCGNAKEGKGSLEVTKEFKLCTEVTKVSFCCFLIYWLLINATLWSN